MSKVRTAFQLADDQWAHVTRDEHMVEVRFGDGERVAAWRFKNDDRHLAKLREFAEKLSKVVAR